MYIYDTNVEMLWYCQGISNKLLDACCFHARNFLRRIFEESRINCIEVWKRNAVETSLF